MIRGLTVTPDMHILLSLSKGGGWVRRIVPGPTCARAAFPEQS